MEQDNIIEQLLRIEEDTSKLLAGSLDEQKSLAGRIAEGAAAIRGQSELDINAKIKSMYDQAGAESAEKVKTIQAQSLQSLAGLQRDYDDHHEAWEESVFQRVLYPAERS